MQKKTFLASFRLLAITLALILIGPYLYDERSALAGDDSSSVDPDFQVLVGSWVRTDGGYLIRVDHIRSNGDVAAEYFNPRPIHVSEANVSMQKKLVRLFIKFEDRGYPGSTYTLYYFAEKDALAGFYFQAALGRTFEVIFLRKK